MGFTQRANNTFHKGLSSDLSPVSEQASTYLDAHDIRIITDTGRSTFALSNVKGHSFSFTFGTTSSVNAIAFTGTIGDTSPVTINIDGNIDIFTPLSWTNYSELYTQLAAFINNSIPLQASGVSYNAYAQPTRVVIYSPDAGGNLTVSLINNDYNTSQVIPSLDDFYLIGYTTIRDSIILITTPSATLNPGGVDSTLPIDPQSSGQVWKLTYDANGSPVLELIYNSIINLTAEHPIPSPGAIVGRYETSTKQSIYWTDNFNRPRRLNIADPLAFGLTVQELYLQSNTSSSVPVLQRILQSGSVKTGMHQFAFRLKSNSGGETVFSMPSNLVSVITSNEETVDYRSYQGSAPGVSSGKSLSYTIPFIDSKYDRIEIINLYYEDAVDPVPEISLFLDEPTGGATSFNFTFTGAETVVQVTAEEYTAFQTEVTRVKALVSKANRLIQGNIIEKRLDFAYDSRAFRYNHLGDTYVTAADIADLTSNSINTNQSPIPHEEGYIFKDPTTTGGALVYGGTGVNVSYEFVPDTNGIDTFSFDANTAQLILDNQPPNWVGPPYRTINRRTFDHNLNGETRPVINTFDSFGVGYTASAIRGYTRDEVYAFSIVFYDLLGNPGFANWIADIRMPHVWMPDPLNPTTDADRQLAFKHTNLLGGWEAYSLGIKFTVNVPDAIKAQVSGYSIVRCERTEEHRTVLGQGILEPSWVNEADYPNLACLVDDGFDVDGVITGIGDRPKYNNSTNLVAMGTDFASFFSPEHMFNQVDFNFTNGDAIDIVTVLNDDATHYAYRDAGIPVDAGTGTYISDFQPRGWVSKNYTNRLTLPNLMSAGGVNYQATFPLRLNISFGEIVPTNTIAKASDLITDITIRDASIPRDSPSTGVIGMSYSTGCTKLVVASAAYSFGGNAFDTLPNMYNADAITTTYDGSTYTLNNRVLIVNYKRARPNQYGGNTYNQRSNRVYIPTGHYTRLDNSTSNINTSIVYGGDTFITAFDIIPRYKAYTFEYPFSPSFDDDRQLRTVKGRIFAVETTVNTDLRNNPSSLVLNKTDFPGTGNGLDYLSEYVLEHVYSRESNIFTFTPKPDPFNEVSEFDNRVRASEEKVNGELVDSWGNFKVGTYIDVEGIYGPINALIINQDRLLFFQDRALGNVDINEKSLVNDQNGDAIQIGASGLLSGYTYISTEIGSKHQWSVLQGNNKVYFLDALKRKLYAYAGNMEPLSEIKGLAGYFNERIDGTILTNDNPILGRGITTTFDYKFSEALFTFRGARVINNQSVIDRWTIAYNENIGAFTSFYSFTPPIYINNMQRLMSSQDRDNYYTHNTGPYNVFYNNAATSSTVKFIVSAQPEQTKKFDYLTWVTEVYNTLNAHNLRAEDTWSKLRVYNDHQNSGYIDLIPKPLSNYNVARNRNREWSIHVPRNAVETGLSNVDILNPTNLDSTQLFKPRMSDNYLTVDLEYDNANNYKFVCPFVITDYRFVY
jgi:hypothetical protein